MSQHKVFSPITCILLFLGFAFYILHLNKTDYWVFANDIAGHLEYIKYIVDHKALPNAIACRECFHPPTYYVISAGVYAVAESSGISPWMAVRCLSLLYYAVFLYYSIKLLSEWIDWQPAYLTALCLVIFWPLGVSKASLISNDPMLYMAEIIGFYFFMRWWRQQIPRDLMIVILWAGMVMAIKLSGILFGLAIVSATAYRCLRQPSILRMFYQPAFLVVIGIAVLLSLVGTAKNYYFLGIPQSNEQVIIPHIRSELSESYALPNDRWYYYASFDFQTYLNKPFFITNDDSTGRYYFWNTVLKSALFGEYVWKSPAMALALAWAQMVMLLYMLASSMFMAWSHRRHYLIPVLFFVGVHVAGLMIFRILYPLASAQDYRYIYACTPLLALLYANAIDWHHQKGRPAMACLGIAIALIFSELAALMIALQNLT